MGTQTCLGRCSRGAGWKRSSAERPGTFEPGRRSRRTASSRWWARSQRRAWRPRQPASLQMPVTRWSSWSSSFWWEGAIRPNFNVCALLPWRRLLQLYEHRRLTAGDGPCRAPPWPAGSRTRSSRWWRTERRWARSSLESWGTPRPPAAGRRFGCRPNWTKEQPRLVKATRMSGNLFSTALELLTYCWGAAVAITVICAEVSGGRLPHPIPSPVINARL